MATLSSILPPVSLSTASGTLPVGNGGTGATTPYPDDGKSYLWDEAMLAWVEITSLTGE